MSPTISSGGDGCQLKLKKKLMIRALLSSPQSRRAGPAPPRMIGHRPPAMRANRPNADRRFKPPNAPGNRPLPGGAPARGRITRAHPGLTRTGKKPLIRMIFDEGSDGAARRAGRIPPRGDRPSTYAGDPAPRAKAINASGPNGRPAISATCRTSRTLPFACRRRTCGVQGKMSIDTCRPPRPCGKPPGGFRRRRSSRAA